MRRFSKSAPPQIMADSWIDWGIDYINRRLENNHSFDFRWPIIGTRPINQHILNDLLNDTDHHCSYCDFSPLRGSFGKTIDHFKPKSDPRFYLEVCKWENLYIACEFCQGAKKDSYNDLLLRPDDIEYNFNKYFNYDVETHEIQVNTHCQGDDKLRAIVTIMIFQMNHPDQTDSRRISYLHYNSAIENPLMPDLHLYSHRFIFE